MELRRRLINALIALGIVVVVVTCGYRFFGQNVTWVNALYMTVITLTSVGYGEMVDTSHSVGLRLFNILVLTFGIGLMLYVFSVSTAFVVEGELKQLFWRRKMLKRIASFHGHVVVCGAGETGVPVVTELMKSGRHVVVVDSDSERLAKFHEATGVAVVEGDATDDEVLEQAGLGRAAGVIATLSADKDNLVVTVLIRQKYPNIRIVARSHDMKMGEKILKAGANSIVSPNAIGGMRLASEMIRPHVVTFLDMMLKDRSSTLRIEEVQVPYHSAWVGRTLGEANLREKFTLTCLALRYSTDESFRYNPDEHEVIKGNCVLVVMGDVENVARARLDASASRAVSR